MAIRPDYTTGTITLTNGSATVTGVGTAFMLAPVRAGDIIIDIAGAPTFGGNTVVGIDAASNTTLTLARPWAGPTLAGVTYRLRFQPDGSRYTATATRLMEILSDGNLESFAALIGAPDTLPYFTGEGTMDITAFTAFARTFLAGADAAAMYGALGTVPNAQLPDRLKQEAQFVTDWNTATSAGFYSCDNTALNQPPVAGYYVGIVWSRGTSVVYQDLIDAGGVAADSKTWRRKFGGGIWGAWYRLRLSEDEQKALYLPRANHTGIIPNDGLPLQRREKYWENPVTNWNNATLSGQYSSINTATNAPYASWWIADVLNTDGVLIVQRARDITAIAAGNTATYERVRRAGVWSAWYLLRTSESEINTLIDAKTRFRQPIYFKDATGWATTSLTDVSSVPITITPTSPTSSLAVWVTLQMENLRDGTAGSQGVAVNLRRYSGSAYVTVGDASGLMFDTTAGVSQNTRGQIQLFSLLTAAQRRSDIDRWTLQPYFWNFYSGNTAKIMNITALMMEIEP